MSKHGNPVMPDRPWHMVCKHVIVVVTPVQGYSTAYFGNLLLLAYFITKGEREAGFIQAIGVVSNATVLTQVAVLMEYLCWKIQSSTTCEGVRWGVPHKRLPAPECSDSFYWGPSKDVVGMAPASFVPAWVCYSAGPEAQTAGCMCND